MTRPVLIRPECVQVAGDLVTGVLLSQIVYWWTPKRLRVHRDGVYWIAKTREDWMAETGLTLEQYKRAIQVLKQRQVVEVRVMRFNGLAVSHLRLLQSIAPTNPPVGGTPAGRGKIPQRSTETTTEKTTTDRSGTVNRDSRSRERGSEGQDTGGIRREKNTPTAELSDVVRGTEQPVTLCHQLPTGGSSTAQGHPVVVTKGWLMRATEVLRLHQPSMTGSLGAFWKSRVALHQDGAYQQPLTGKECGQLKQLAKVLGPDIRPVIEYAVSHWWKFSQAAAVSAGVSCPADPHIGFLLKYHGVAVNLLKPLSSSSLVVKEAVPLQSIAAKQTETEPVYTPTFQELMGLIDGLTTP